MSGSLNKVILIGRLGKDPEERRMNSGDAVISFSLATSENWKDKNSGERKEKTEWHNIVIFNDNLGKLAMQYLKKGSMVYIEGQIQTRKWQDKDGNDRYTTEIVLQRYRGEMTFLDSKGGGSASNDDFMSGGEGGGNYAPKKVASGGGGSTTHGSSGFGGNDLDDEIPF